MKFIIGLIVSFAVGVGCRYFDVPVGSPAVLPGAFIVLAMTAGYSWTNQILNTRSKSATTAHLCGGPTGQSAANGHALSGKVIVSKEWLSTDSSSVGLEEAVDRASGPLNDGTSGRSNGRFKGAV